MPDSATPALAAAMDAEVLDHQQQTDLLKRCQAAQAIRNQQHAADPETAAVILREGRRATDKMVCTNLRLIWSVARRRGLYSAAAASDILADGAVGLLEAIERFDPARGNRFSTYATWYILKTLQDGDRNRHHAVRPPRQLPNKLAQLNTASEELTRKHGRQPTREELAAATGQSAVKVAALQRLRRGPRSLDAPLTDDSSTPLRLADVLADPTVDDPDEVLQQQAMRNTAQQILERVDDDSRTVLIHRLGLGTPAKSTRELARMLAVSRTTILTYEAGVLSRLRHPSNRISQPARSTHPPAATPPDASGWGRLSLRTASAVPAPGRWTQQAACRSQDTEVFFAGGDRYPNQALSICGSCPVADACRQYAAAVRGLQGVWGGQTATERQRSRRARSVGREAA